jgi:hypothetical protein
LPSHLLLPRTKGFATSVQHLRSAPHVKAVYDVTVAYADTQPASQASQNQRSGKKSESKGKGKGKGKTPAFAFQSPPTFTQSVFVPDVGKRWKTLVHVRRFPIEELPLTEAGLKFWLEERWLEKGRLLEELRQRLVRGEGFEEE